MRVTSLSLTLWRLGHAVPSSDGVCLVFHSPQPVPGQCHHHHVLRPTHQVLGERLQVSAQLRWKFSVTHFLPSKLCTTYSYVHYQPQNNRKIHINFAKRTFKTCGRELPVYPLADFCQKRSVNLLAIVKTKVYSRILTTSAQSELVGNELRQILLCLVQQKKKKLNVVYSLYWLVLNETNFSSCLFQHEASGSQQHASSVPARA
jgi:hypothetical protein